VTEHQFADGKKLATTWIWRSGNQRYLDYFLARLAQVNDWAVEQVDMYNKGRAANKQQRKAAKMFLRVAEAKGVDKRTILKRCVGFLLECERRPGLVTSYRAKQFQLARVFLTTTSLRHASGHPNAYIPSGVLKTLGAYLMDAFEYGTRRAHQLILEEQAAAGRFPGEEE
jgi:hypothetical protein